MTFGAFPAWQAWLLLAAAAALAIGLFLIRLRPPRLIIPSMLLWRRVLDEAREQTLWERIRRAVSLVLTVLIALAIALAATRPGRSSAEGSVAAGRLLVVLDSSSSMLARTRSGDTRWDRAVAEARRLFGAASGAEIALATTADGLVEGPTTDGALIETALDRVAPGSADFASSLAWPRLAGAGAIHFITDGALPRVLDPKVVVHSVFEPASNVAITALEVRPALVLENAGDAYLEVANFALAPQKVRLQLTRGPASLLDREFDMGASEVLRQVIPLARGGDAAIGARVTASHNALDRDDEARAWLDRARPLTVVVVGAELDWLRSAFARDPDVRAMFVDPARFEPALARDAKVDVLVFDRWAPADAPARPALLFAPPASTPWLSAGQGDAPRRLDERRPRWEIPGSHPAVEGVDPFTISIERARAYSLPSLATVAASTNGTPLVSVTESADRRLVVVGFGADESNLSSAPGFPVLLGNALDWLARPAVLAGRLGQRTKPGLVTFEGPIVKVTGPKDAEVPLTRVGGRAMAQVRDAGLYMVEGGGARSMFAVNVGDPQLSNLTRTTPLPSGQARAVVGGTSARPWWVYCAVAAFGLVLAEWWSWQRRITV